VQDSTQDRRIVASLPPKTPLKIVPSRLQDLQDLKIFGFKTSRSTQDRPIASSRSSRPQDLRLQDFKIFNLIATESGLLVSALVWRKLHLRCDTVDPVVIETQVFTLTSLQRFWRTHCYIIIHFCSCIFRPSVSSLRPPVSALRTPFSALLPPRYSRPSCN
jgi:hypothetical protein